MAALVHSDSLTGIQNQIRSSMSFSSKRASQISLLAEAASDTVEFTDERYWSWSYLRNMFRLHDMGELYKRYAQRLQNAYFNVYLLIQIGMSFLYAGALLIVNEEDVSNAIPEVIVHMSLVVCCLVMFCLICDERAFRYSPRVQEVVSIFTVVLITCSDLGLSLYFYTKRERRIRTASTFHTLIIIYFFLPLPRKYQTITLGCLVSVTHLLISGILLYSQEPNRLQRIAADAVYYFCGNFVGIYSQLLAEVTLRRAFLDRRGYIRSTIKKQHQKDQEEQLLQSILPNHISVEVKRELLEAIREMESTKGSVSNGSLNHVRSSHNHHNHHPKKQKHTSMHKKPFSDLFVERHNNVTVLYADIVNFTALTVTLKAEELVETLNELFGRFDEAAQSRDCLRIKLLGDCYYCVSGLPNPTPDHAKNCVRLGFDMIQIIKEVREKLKVDVNMRIGIHSGDLFSGLIGIYKWQYDIWSKDVTIANRMEQCGQPGRIHITKQTKDILSNEYRYQPWFGRLRDKYLDENDVDTYLVLPNKNNNTDEESQDDELDDLGSPKGFNRTKKSGPGGKKRINSSSSKKSADSLIRVAQRKSFLRATDEGGANVLVLRDMLGRVDKQMAKAIDEMPLRKTDQWCGNAGQESVHPLFMCFNNFSSEAKFQTQPDPLFKFYIGCSLFILICIGFIQALILPSHHTLLWIAFSVALSYLVILIPFVWVSYVWKRVKDPYRDLDPIPEPDEPLIRFFYVISNSVTNSWVIRIIIYVTIAVVVSIFAIVDVEECDGELESSTSISEYSGTTVVSPASQECEHPWYFTYSCALAILTIYGFFRINFILKLLLCVLSMTGYSLTMGRYRFYVFDQEKGASPALPAIYSHIIYLVKLVLLLHIMDRQMEYINRLDFIWKKKLSEEHKEAATSQIINTILIHNILPVQIAKIYMDPSRVGETHSRNYTDVTVMFASIPNFMDHYNDIDLTDSGMKCLKVLNEIIVEFDQLLVNYIDIEKMKVISSSYMAAGGLEVHDSGRASTASGHKDELGYFPPRREEIQRQEPDLGKRRRTLLSMVKFAGNMMSCLQKISLQENQDFQLRVGLDCGPVVAGVIGAHKPLYDIWGDTVNMASRMDSTGMRGKIQWLPLVEYKPTTALPDSVAKNSAKLLTQAGVKCEFRAKTKVKGKDHLIPTYFVVLDEFHKVQFDYGDTDRYF